MKTLIFLGLMLLLLSNRSGAETYSWVDGNGTYNFSDDYNSIPKKYRKNVKRSGDVVDSEPTQNAAPVEKPEVKPAVAEKSAVPAAGDKQLYGGKTQEAWRKDFEVQEVELKRLEQQLEQLKNEINKPNQSSRVQQSELIKQYNAIRVEYTDKYKIYSELMESARKAGLTVEIKK